MAKRKVTNPLALAVLAVLSEQPMHPYHIAATLKGRGKERSIRLKYGSLYTVVDSLARSGFIRSVSTSRRGRRPERTMYALTPAGEDELHEWLVAILRTPAKEYPEFEVALSLIAAVPPEAAAAALEEREQLLTERLDRQQRLSERLNPGSSQQLFVLELEYECAMLRAERTWVRNFARKIQDGTLEYLEDWRHWHGTARPPERTASLADKDA
jgi:DNA-binding PadR family transcriptional regulator